MESTASDLLVAGVVLVGLVLMPLASRLVFSGTRQVAAELDGGRAGSDLARHLDRRYATSHEGERAMIQEETRQLRQAIAYVRRNRTVPVSSGTNDE